MKKAISNKPQQKNSEKNTGKAKEEKRGLVSDMGIGFKMLDFKSNHIMYGEE